VTAHSVLGLLGAFAVTFGLLALTLRWIGRWNAGSAADRRGFPLRVLHRVPTGPRQGVALLQVGERVLVVSLADAGARLLAELDGDDRSRALTSPTATAPKHLLPFSIPGLGRLALVVSLLVIAPAARAQSTSAPTRPATTAPATAPARTRTAPIVTGSPAPAKPATVGGGVAPAIPTFGVLPPAPPKVDVRVGEGKDQVHLEGAVGLVVFLGVLTLLPALFLLMTSFTRILIVLHFLRSALGTQTAPPSQLLVAIAVLLTGVVMNPTLQRTQAVALKPYFDGRINQSEAYQRGIQPFRQFMLANTRTADLNTFANMSGIAKVDSVEQLPTVTVVSAFVISELRTAFQMGFVIYLPFIVVDLIVASVLMSLGMFMLPPVMISLPFKLLLFVLADGWTLVVQNLVASFRS